VGKRERERGRTVRLKRGKKGTPWPSSFGLGGAVGCGRVRRVEKTPEFGCKTGGGEGGYWPLAGGGGAVETTSGPLWLDG